MKAFIKSWQNKIYDNLKNSVPMSKLEKQLFKRDIKNCYTLDDVAKIKDVLKLAKKDFSFQEIVDLNNDIFYQKTAIELCNENYTQERYPAHEISKMFDRCNSYIKVDALLIHLRRNKENYLSEYNDLPKMSSIDVFVRMANKQKEYLLDAIKYDKA